MSKKIYIQDWLSLKPYKEQCVTDSYYLKLSNHVKKILLLEEPFFREQNMDEEDINRLACFFTSYFEDIISGTNIWNSFVRKHKQLYQKHLPFYETKEYCEGEINVEDIRFLTWYFVNATQENKFISPYHPQFFIISDRVMDIFEDAWEYAPENKRLQSLYKIDVNGSDYYVVRKLIDTVLFHTYLFHIDTGTKIIEAIIEVFEKEEDEEKIPSLLNEIRDDMLHNSHTQLLALTGKEWTAEILGGEHPLYQDLISMSKKILGWFFYKGQNETDIFLEHIASGMKFNMTKKSYDHSEELHDKDKLLFMGIVRWKNEWWFSGIQVIIGFDADLILDEKNSLKSRNAVAFLYHQSDKVQEMLDEQFVSFLKFNKGLQIAFMPTSEIDDFIKKYTEFYNDSLNLSEKEIKDAEARHRKDGFFPENELKFSDVAGEEHGTALVFYNPRSGAEIVLEANSAFPLPNNPYFKKEQSEEHLIRLLMDKGISADLVWFCMHNCKSKLPFFKKGIGTELLKDMDFFLRLWKGRNYFQEPSITMIGEE